ncbi:MAG: type II toxin-antitoxin system RelE/ParE family toxin [archaeon]
MAGNASEWKILWSSHALSELSKIDRPDAERIIEKLDQVAGSENPARFLSRLVGYDEFKLRVGDYRAIILLLNGEKTIFIENLGHRERVYRR